MASEMVERVARVLWESVPPGPRSWDLLHPLKQNEVRSQARAVIAAMREPSAEIYAIAHAHDSIAGWRAMIDQILA